jgi:formate dehydrogenase subunit delta
VTPEKLTHMANQIAAFFRAYPEGEAVVGVRDHIEAFWTPTMVTTLRAHVAAGGAGVDQLVVRAMSEPKAAAAE